MSSDRRRQFSRFCVVGAIGFGIDGGVLFALVRSGLDPFFARTISFPLAASVTWRLNRNWTFETKARRFGRYLAVQIVGAFSNYACYVIVLFIIEPNVTNVLIALAIGSLIGLFVNFSGSRGLVFNKTPGHDNSEKSRLS